MLELCPGWSYLWSGRDGGRDERRRVNKDQCIFCPRGEGRGAVPLILIVIVTNIFQGPR